MIMIMNVWLALFRGINVGGKNILPMKDLVPILEGLGLECVRTYIQSGNVVFCAPERPQLETEIADRIEAERGFRPRILLLDARKLQASMAANPFPQAESEPKSLHLFFLEHAPPSPDLDALRAVEKESERFELIGDVFYLHAPDGIGRSKLVTQVEKALGVAATARNWRTATKIKGLVSELEDTYGSGLNLADWRHMQKLLLPFIHAKEPAAVAMPAVPEHLQSHPLIQMIRRYRQYGREEDLDEAGRLLFPTDKPFDWYLPLTK